MDADMVGWAVRLVGVSRVVDKAYGRFDRARSALVLRLASDAALDRLNEHAYGQTGAYDPSSASFRSHLFPWEEAAIAAYFPSPPARLLIGGAGGGREGLALLRAGYSIVAFDPSPALVERFAVAVPPGADAEVLRARYEDMTSPSTDPKRLGPPVDDWAGRFDGAILGWGSFSHLRNEAQRVDVLRAFGRCTSGPILLSLLATRSDDEPAAQQRGSRSGLGRCRPTGDAFSMSIGFYHRMSESEIRSVVDRAGLRLIHLSMDERDTNWPHVVATSSPVDPSDERSQPNDAVEAIARC